jgi:Ca2+-binding RTX toxin-like protein
VLLNGNSSQNADFVVSAIVADSDNTFFGDGSGESLINLATSNIHIYDKLGNLIDPSAYAGLGIALTDLGDKIEIDGIKDGMAYEIVTDDAHKFNAVGVDALATTDTFSLSFFTYGENSAGTAVDLSYKVVGTDGDGDPANGTIDVSLYPDATSSSGTTFAGTAGNDTFLGTQGVDTISGANGDDRLAGNAGIDTISGGAGKDTIIGGSGNDILSGGADSDTFVHETLVDGKDAISDFDTAAPGSGGDKLDISQVLDHAGNTWTDGNTVADAVAGGYITFTDDGAGKVQVNVDIDGSAGNSFAPAAVAVLTNVAFTTAGAAATALDDNIVVG